MTTDIRELLARAWYEGEVRQYEAWWREKFGDDEDDDPYPSWNRVQPHGRERMLAKVDGQLAALKEAGQMVLSQKDVLQLLDDFEFACSAPADPENCKGYQAVKAAAGRLDT